MNIARTLSRLPDATPVTIQSACVCGVKYVIVHGSTSCRKDNKRVYPVGHDLDDNCSFRCINCKRPVDESVPGAEFDIA